MKILFIDPPFQRFMGYHRYYYPLGLASMAAVLAARGHDVKILDMEHSADADTLSWGQAVLRYDDYINALNNPAHPVWLEAGQVLDAFAPDVVGITMLTPKMPSATLIARICKAWRPSVPIVVGADHPTVMPETTLRDQNIDYVVRGEGEQTIVELVECLEKGDQGRLGSIDGLSYRCKDGPVHNVNRALIPDLDRLPFARIDALIGCETYRPVDLGAVMGSRGCPYHCTFCGVANVWSRRIRHRSPANIVDEIESLNRRRGVRYVSFRDAEFCLKRPWVLAICREIRSRGLDVEWECLTRADDLDDELVAAMKEAGCATMRIGIESGSPVLLRKMRKATSLDAIRTGAALLMKHDIYWSAYFLFGTPYETRETLNETVAFIREIDPPFITPARYSPIPGSPMYDELMSAGRIAPDIDWGLESNQRFDSHYIFAMDNADFASRMAEISAFIEEHNRSWSAEHGRRDQRLK
ncbi:B12-binding domain-containing radical SAM protein [bacterium]|nr:B12-binding domain-containing radical SAM protein [bacterium]